MKFRSKLKLNQFSVTIQGVKSNITNFPNSFKLETHFHLHKMPNFGMPIQVISIFMPKNSYEEKMCKYTFMVWLMLRLLKSEVEYS